MTYATYTITGKVIRSARVFETTVYAKGPADALRLFHRDHRRSLFLGFVKIEQDENDYSGDNSWA